MSRVRPIACRPLTGTIADQPPLVQAMIREGVDRALAVAPAGVTLQREKTEMAAQRNLTVGETHEEQG